MIIEDQFLVATQIEDALRDMGFSEFDFIDNEADAVQAARANCPDLITADQRLISGTGIRAVAAICAEQGDLPTIYITEFRAEVRKILPDAVIVGKPFGARLLQEAVARSIEQSRRIADVT